MGIQGLLPLVKEALVPQHLRDYKGKTIAVDAYVWLHKGVYTCAQEVALGQPTAKYVTYCMNKVRLLQHFGVTPYIVFDGGPLPSKGGTETDRAGKRQSALQKANAFLAAGNSNAARDEFVKAVDVTPAMAYQFIKALKDANVAYVVAPYEADAQLAFLERYGHVDAIISEDSDLIIYGCNVVLFKMDPAGSCIEYRRDRLTACREYQFHGWTDDRLRHMAIISGCDYLEGLSGLGIKTVHGLFHKYKTYRKVIESIRMAGKVKVPQYYDRDFRRADLTFQHQRVFDPASRQAVHLSPLPSKGMSESEIDNVGGIMTTELALDIATGDVDPSTGLAMVDIGGAAAASPPIKPTPLQRSTSFYKPKAAKPAASNGPLDSFFARKPTAAAKGKKRNAFDELKPNVPAQQRAPEPEPSLSKVASRFFGKPSPPPSPQPSPGQPDEPDDDELGALMEIEAAGREEVDIECDVGSLVSTQRTEVEPLCDEAGPALSMGEDLPSSQMVDRSSPPTSSSPRKRRRLLETDEAAVEAMRRSSPVSVKRSSRPCTPVSSPAYCASPISSPAEAALATPTKKLVTDWHQRFKRGAASSTSSRGSSAEDKSATTLAPSSSVSSVEPSPPKAKAVSLPAVKRKDLSPKKPSPVATRRSPTAPVTGTVTSRTRPLSSFLYRRPIA